MQSCVHSGLGEMAKSPGGKLALPPFGAETPPPSHHPVSHCQCQCRHRRVHVLQCMFSTPHLAINALSHFASSSLASLDSFTSSYPPAWRLSCSCVLRLFAMSSPSSDSDPPTAGYCPSCGMWLSFTSRQVRTYPVPEKSRLLMQNARPLTQPFLGYRLCGSCRTLHNYPERWARHPENYPRVPGPPHAVEQPVRLPPRPPPSGIYRPRPSRPRPPVSCITRSKEGGYGILGEPLSAPVAGLSKRRRRASSASPRPVLSKASKTSSGLRSPVPSVPAPAVPTVSAAVPPTPATARITRSSALLAAVDKARVEEATWDGAAHLATLQSSSVRSAPRPPSLDLQRWRIEYAPTVQPADGAHTPPVLSPTTRLRVYPLPM